MASRGLGTLTLDLVVKTGGFEAGMDRAARTTDRRMKEIEARATKFGKILGTAIAGAATAALTGVLALTKNAIDAADRLNDISERLGVSTEALSAWGYAAEQSGTDLEALNTGLTRFTKNVAAAADANSRQGEIFAALGVSVKDAAGNLRSVETLVPEIAQAFKDLNNATLEASLAQELFGKSGANLLQFLNLGSDGLSEMEQRARDLGIVISQDTARAADEFNDQLNDLKSLVGGLGTQIAAELLPDLIELVSQFKELVKEGSLVDKVVGAIRFTMDDLSTSFNSINGLIKDTTNFFGGLADGASAALGVLQGIVSLDWNKVKTSFQQGMAADERIWSRSEQRPRGTGTNFPIQDILRIPALNPPQPFSIVPATPMLQGNRSSESKLNELLANRDKAAARSGGGRKKKDTSLEDMARDAEKARQELERLVEQEAQARDAFEAMAASLAGPLADANYQFIKDQERLNQLAKEGAIGAKELETAQTNLRIAHEKNVEAINAQLTPSQEVIAGLREEIELIGLSDIAQQKLIATKQAGKEATEEEIAEIERLIDAREQANKAADLQREVEAGLADAIYDVASGAKSAGDAVKDFFDDLAKYILRMIAENWAKQIAGLFSGQAGASASGGASGTNWISLIAGLFGGGKATGGWTQSWGINEVNERGFEMATVGGKDYMLTGSQPVRITPNDQLQGAGGVVQNISFNVAGRVSDETRTQAAAKIAYATQRATVRNS